MKKNPNEEVIQDSYYFRWTEIRVVEPVLQRDGGLFIILIYRKMNTN
jgi:hypothetical protein